MPERSRKPSTGCYLIDSGQIRCPGTLISRSLPALMEAPLAPPCPIRHPLPPLQWNFYGLYLPCFFMDFAHFFCRLLVYIY